MIERRRFLKTLGLTGSALAVERCAPAPSDTLLPYLISPADIVPGIPTQYATTCRQCPAGCGMVVTTMSGRITKCEGNPAHPISRGHLCARGQASVQALYNPDRFGMPRQRGADGTWRQISWSDAEPLLGERLRRAKERGANRIAWVGGLATGAMEALVRQWLQALRSDRLLMYETFDYEPLRAAGRLAFDRPEIPRYDLDRAEYVIAFGAEFLETYISNVEFTSAYAALRRKRLTDPDGSFTWVSPHLPLTGLNSDAWVPARPGSEAFVALAIAHAMIKADLTHPSAAPHLAWIARAVAPFAADRIAAATDVAPDSVAAMARRFARTSPSLALGGGVSGAGERHAVDLEVAVLMLNVLAGNIGTTVHYGAGSALDGAATRAELEALTRAMAAGDIDVVLVHDANPAGTLPASLGFVDALRRVPFVVTFANTPDETSDRAHLILPDHHFLESWGDYTPRAGVAGLLQPAAVPLHQSRATGEVLIATAPHVDEETAAAVGTTGWPDRVRRQWLGQNNPDVGDDGDATRQWTEALSAGGRFEAPPTVDVALRDLSVTIGGIGIEPQRDEGYTLVACASPHFYDGRDANQPWLREVPDPVMKTVWNGWIAVHPDTARRLGVADGGSIEVESRYGRIEAPCHVYAGLRPDTIAAPIGFGRSSSLRYAGGRGPNVMALLPPQAADGEQAAWTTGPVRLGRGLRGPLAIRLQTADAHDAATPSPARIVNPASATRPLAAATESIGLYPPHVHREHRWGMAIDLNACTGCNACVVACYAENNVPIVGEQECAHGREMSWIRIERHALAVSSDRGMRHPGTVFLPMLCQHCDQAPCESVCPVYATYHNPEGLNAQVYNRCIGTRFCSNNCPYKVRRFNWAAPGFPPPLDTQLNPLVTVRSAGVMEKCTFCVQRIQAGKSRARRDGRTLRDGDITPACAQTCPADAIVFGDLHDPESRVSRLAADARAYRVLAELNTRPAIAYLARSVPGAPDDGRSAR